MKIPLPLWLWWHGRHGTGPVRKSHPAAKQLDPKGRVVGPPLSVVWYRCECGAVRTISKAPADG